MKRLGKWLAILVALIVAGIALLMVAFPSATVRYRLTLEATVRGEPRTGSGVVEVTYGKSSTFLSHSELSIDVRGEAVSIDLGERGRMFALLKGDTDSRSSPEWIVFRAANFPHGNLPRPVEEGLRQLGKLSGKYELPLTSLPLLVRFRDLSDPGTVERVDPLDIGKSFGDGAKLTRATLEIVPSEPITTGIERQLPWWNGSHPWLKPVGNGVFVDIRTENFQVNKEDFKRGV
ncbi:MAG: hypothetical protein V4458_13985 [Pseudomonadota bacterium]|nr:hypothetical protein [Afipia sp.]